MTPEGKIAAYLVRRVLELGGEQRKVEWSGRRGAPDRLILFPHVHAFVELKSCGKKPEPHQAREFDRLRFAGLAVFVVDSKASVDVVLDGLYNESLRQRAKRGRIDVNVGGFSEIMKEENNAP